MEKNNAHRKKVQSNYSPWYLAFSLIGYVINEPYFITLATKIVILGIAGCALNLILGFGGMVSFGHAMFFGVGSYVAAISAFHSMNGESINLIFFDFNGSNQMLFNWFLAVIFSMFFALVVGSISIRTSGVYFIMITLAFAQMTYYFSVGGQNMVVKMVCLHM